MSAENDEVTELLERWNRGDPEALAKLMPLVVEELRAIAAKYFAREDPDNTLRPTALVNELYLRLNGCRTVHWKSPGHFFRSAAGMMRRLLVDHARSRKAAKRGGGVLKIPLFDDIALPDHHDLDFVIDLDEALERLEAMDPRQCQVFELKAFAGLINDEIAKTLEISPTSVKRELQHAKAWLKRELRGRRLSRSPRAAVETPGDST
ncbi:MAG: ECF-type sigma factor [Thermoanaerobaculia bacterium]